MTLSEIEMSNLAYKMRWRMRRTNINRREAINDAGEMMSYQPYIKGDSDKSGPCYMTHPGGVEVARRLLEELA